MDVVKHLRMLRIMQLLSNRLIRQKSSGSGRHPIGQRMGTAPIRRNFFIGGAKRTEGFRQSHPRTDRSLKEESA